MSITRFEPDYYKMVHILDGDWVHYSAHMDEVNALCAKIKQLSVDAARLCSRGNRLERENANLQAMCDEMLTVLDRVSENPMRYTDWLSMVNYAIAGCEAMKLTNEDGGE